MLVAVPSICDNIFLPSRGLCLSMFGSCYVIPYLYTSYGMSDTHPGFAFLRSYVSSLYNTPRLTNECDPWASIKNFTWLY